MQQAMRNYDQRLENTEPAAEFSNRFEPEEIKAYVTDLGYLYCPRCAAEFGLDTSNAYPVWERDCAHDGDECDACSDLVPPTFYMVAN